MNFNPDRIVIQEQLPPLENDRFLDSLEKRIPHFKKLMCVSFFFLVTLTSI